MRKYWPLLAIALVLAAIIGMSQYADSAKQRHEESVRQAKIAAVAKGYDSKASNNAEDTYKSPVWAKFVTWPEGVGAWAVILTLFVIAWQSAETRAAANATEKSVVLAADAAAQSSKEMQLEQRAWVGVAAGEMEVFAPNQRVRANLRIKNTGKSFALHATLFQRILSIWGQEPLRQFPETPSAEVGITLLPGAEFIAQVEGGNTPLNQVEFDAIKTGKAFIYMYATIRYQDVLGSHHRTEFSLIFNPALKSFQAYQGHNEAD